jgi:predicted Zn-dependent protease
MPRGCAILLLLALLHACAPDERRADAGRERFERALAEEDVREALEAVDDLKTALPDTAQSQLELASLLMRVGEASQALWLLDAATKRHPQSTVLKIGLAEVALTLGDPSTALRTLAPVAPDDPAIARVLVLRANAHIDLGDLEAGLSLYEAAEEQFPEDFALRKMHFEVLRREKSFELALALLDEASALETLTDAQRRWIELGHVDVLNDQGQREAALRKLESRIAQHPDDGEAWRRRTDILLAEGRAEEVATELARAVEKDPELLDLYAMLADAERARGDEAAAEEVLRELVRRDPDPHAFGLLARHLHEAGRTDEGAAVLAEALEARGVRASLELHYLYVAMLLSAGREEVAREQFEEFRRRHPRNPRVDYLRARFALAEGDTKTAIPLLKRVASQLDRSDVQHWLGMAYEMQGDDEAAEFRYGLALHRDESQLASYAGMLRTFERRAMWRNMQVLATILSRLAPGNPLGYDFAVRAMLASGQAAAAEQASRVYAERFPDLPEPPLLLAQALRITGRSQEALIAIDQALEHHPDDGRLLAERAMALAMLGRGAEGLQTLDRALAQGEADATLHRARAFILFVSDREAEARSDVEQAVLLDPDDPSPLKMAADAFAMRGDPARAIPYYDRYLERRPKDGAVLFRLGFALERSGDATGAVAAYRLAAAADEQAVAPRNNLAVLLESEGRLDEALEAAQAAYAVSDSNPAVMDTLGWLYLRKGSATRAVALLEKAAALEPRNVETRYHLALACREAGQLERAQELLSALQAELDSSHELYGQVDEAVASLP